MSVTLEQISRLRNLQKESNSITDDIIGSLESKCREPLLDVLETVLENAAEFPDSDSILRVIEELKAKPSNKKDRSGKKKKTDDTHEA